MAWVTSKCKARKLYFFARFVGIFSGSKLMLVSKKLFSPSLGKLSALLFSSRIVISPSSTAFQCQSNRRGKRQRIAIPSRGNLEISSTNQHVVYKIFFTFVVGHLHRNLSFKKRTRGFFEGSKNVTLSRRFY